MNIKHTRNINHILKNLNINLFNSFDSSFSLFKHYIYNFYYNNTINKWLFSYLLFNNLIINYFFAALLLNVDNNVGRKSISPYFYKIYISNPIYEYTNNNINIVIYYYFNDYNNNYNNFIITKEEYMLFELNHTIKNIFNVNFELIKLNYPHMDSNIFNKRLIDVYNNTNYNKITIQQNYLSNINNNIFNILDINYKDRLLSNINNKINNIVKHKYYNNKIDIKKYLYNINKEYLLINLLINNYFIGYDIKIKGKLTPSVSKRSWIRLNKGIIKDNKSKIGLSNPKINEQYSNISYNKSSGMHIAGKYGITTKLSYY